MEIATTLVTTYLPLLGVQDAPSIRLVLVLGVGQEARLFAQHDADSMQQIYNRVRNIMRIAYANFELGRTAALLFSKRRAQDFVGFTSSFAAVRKWLLFFPPTIRTPAQSMLHNINILDLFLLRAPTERQKSSSLRLQYFSNRS